MRNKRVTSKIKHYFTNDNDTDNFTNDIDGKYYYVYNILPYYHNKLFIF